MPPEREVLPCYRLIIAVWALQFQGLQQVHRLSPSIVGLEAAGDAGGDLL